MRRPGPRERHLPLAGENDEDRKNDEPEHEQPHHDGRAILDGLGCAGHRSMSVPTVPFVVNLALRGRTTRTMLSKVMVLGKRSESIGRELLGLRALALILPR